MPGLLSPESFLLSGLLSGQVTVSNRGTGGAAFLHLWGSWDVPVLCPPFQPLGSASLPLSLLPSIPPSPLVGVCRAVLPSKRSRFTCAGTGFPETLTKGWNLGFSLTVQLGP